MAGVVNGNGILFGRCAFLSALGSCKSSPRCKNGDYGAARSSNLLVLWKGELRISSSFLFLLFLSSPVSPGLLYLVLVWSVGCWVFGSFLGSGYIPSCYDFTLPFSFDPAPRVAAWLLLAWVNLWRIYIHIICNDLNDSLLEAGCNVLVIELLVE